MDDVMVSPDECPQCHRKAKIIPLVVMGETLYQRQCVNWNCGKTTNLDEDEVKVWEGQGNG